MNQVIFVGEVREKKENGDNTLDLLLKEDGDMGPTVREVFAHLVGDIAVHAKQNVVPGKLVAIKGVLGGVKDNLVMINAHKVVLTYEAPGCTND